MNLTRSISKIYLRSARNAAWVHRHSLAIILPLIAAMAVYLYRYYQALPNMTERTNLRLGAIALVAAAGASWLRLALADHSKLSKLHSPAFAARVRRRKLAVAAGVVSFLCLAFLTWRQSAVFACTFLAVWVVAGLGSPSGHKRKVSRFAGNILRHPYLVGFEKTLALMVNSRRYFWLLAALVLGLVISYGAAISTGYSCTAVTVIANLIVLYYASAMLQDEVGAFGKRLAPRFRVKSIVGEWLFWFSHFLVVFVVAVTIDVADGFFLPWLFVGALLEAALVLFAQTMAKYLYPGQRIGQLIFIAISALVPLVPCYFFWKLYRHDD